MEVKFYDLNAVNEPFEEKFNLSLKKVMGYSSYIQGQHCAEFEAKFSKYCNAKHCVGVGNGLDALRLSLNALNIKAGDEVIVPAFTFIATWIAVSQTGGTPVAVDVETNTANIDPSKIESAITSRTRAIIAVHLYGRPADLAAIKSICSKHGLYLIEDAAQAHGAEFQRKKVGSLSDIAAFSFYPTKNLGALGDGGCITTDSAELASKIRVLSNYGSSARYKNDVIGANSRLDEIQAAFLLSKICSLDKQNQMRQKIAELYSAKLPKNRFLIPPLENVQGCVWHLYPIRSTYRTELARHLKSQSIGTLIHYPIPPHLQACYKGLGYKPGNFPEAERWANTTLSLPLYPNMPIEAIEQVIEACRFFYRNLNP
jgi:dTDP-4-amino-4,6-dideoxygalactose transaminase